MANKYLIHGATYCGDGTASNEAASAGAAGAWNDINVLEGATPAYGALVAGDVVYIRSKTSAGADITRTLAAAVSLGSASATSTSPITWVLDNGTVWSGIDGILTYTNDSAYMTTFRINNVFVAKTRHAWKVKNTATGSAAVLASVHGYADGVEFDTSAKTGTSGAVRVLLGNGAVLENPSAKVGRIANVPSDNAGFFCPGEYTYGFVGSIINPEIELKSTTPAGSIFGGAYMTSGVMRIVGGRIYGVGATTGQAVFVSYASDSPFNMAFDSVGLQIPRSMDMFNTSAPRMSAAEARVVAADSSLGGHYDQAWGYATSRTDNNPPYLAGELPDSAHTAWSYRVYPRLATVSRPMVLTYTKLYTGTAAAKDISLEILVANTMAANKRNLWATISYTDDTTGLPKSISTRDHAAGSLDDSTANWSATVWGMVSFLKKKLAVTTPTAVKQNTPIIVTLFGTLASTTANDIYFVDPDFGVN